ncbi:MAG: AAA family ATPase [Paludibacteraceae bacterium]|nr:AAA family ATPase [Paludibacteraceae bacterium]
MLNRYYKIEEEPEESLFLFGARQTGKTTLLKEKFPSATFVDLLDLELLQRFTKRPALFHQMLMQEKPGSLVIVDEIQQLPILLNEVHWFITNRQLRFILCGSSARKLKRNGTNTLGGRALPCRLYPLVSAEIEDFDVVRACNHGMLPKLYLCNEPQRLMEAYVDIYLREEIKAEALVRNLAGFSRFLEVAAQTSGEMINYNNIAADCGVSANTVKEYFSVLQDTLIGYLIPAFNANGKRQCVQSPRFYFFDVSISNYLLKRSGMLPGMPEFGHAFEQFIIQELVAYMGYNHINEELSYWRTYLGKEVDVVIGKARVAIEIKSAEEIQSKHMKGLAQFAEDYPECRRIIVSLDRINRVTSSNIELIYVYDFLRQLWNGEII